MNRIINIPNRLNWIDWAKVFAISCVVFGHIPQIQGSFPQDFVVIFHLPLFFFISGYLTKKEYLNKETLKKYCHTLIIPYFCYNLLFYPYWILRHYIEVPNAELYDYVKPLIGMIMLQADSTYYEQLNGVTWFIASLIGYKLILSSCNRLKYGYILIFILMAISSVVYVHNQFNLYIRDLTPVGFVKCFPFYYIGYYCRQKNYVATAVHKYDLLSGIVCSFVSILIYFVFRNPTSMIVYGLRYWLISLFAIMGVIGICKFFDKVHFSFIDNISVGTIVIMGVHFILIGSTNFFFEHVLSINGKIIYPWYIAFILVLVFEVIIYPLILLFRNKYPFMLGKRL